MIIISDHCGCAMRPLRADVNSPWGWLATVLTHTYAALQGMQELQLLHTSIIVACICDATALQIHRVQIRAGESVGEPKAFNVNTIPCNCEGSASGRCTTFMSATPPLIVASFGWVTRSICILSKKANAFCWKVLPLSPKISQSLCVQSADRCSGIKA